MATINFRSKPLLQNMGLDYQSLKPAGMAYQGFHSGLNRFGLSVGMSHVEFADGAYFTNVSIKNEWYESARGLKKLARNMIRIMISVRIRHFLLCMPPTYFVG
ncbi:MAG: hypothetical protein ACLT63_06680 [Bacteroides xylanisolvens]